MIFLLFSIIFLCFKYFCFGCFPNPQSSNGPLIKIGGMFECPLCPASPCSISGPYVDIILDPTVMADDCSCKYTAIATCNPLRSNKLEQVMQFNGNDQSIDYPLPLTCDQTTNQYTYDNAGTPTQITSVQCCLFTCLPINKQPTEVDNIFAPDSSCTYHRKLSCINGSPTMRINAPPGVGTGAGFPGPETFLSGAVEAICPIAATRYVHNSPMFGPNTVIGKASCP